MELLANEPLQRTLSESTRLEKRINGSKNHKLETLICVATSIFERKIQRLEHGNEAAKLEPRFCVAAKTRVRGWK